MSGAGGLPGGRAGDASATVSPPSRPGRALTVTSCPCCWPVAYPAPRVVRASSLVSLALRGGLQHRLDHSLGVEVGWCLAWWEVLEGGCVLLDDGRRGQHRPELLTCIKRVGRRVHVLL